MGCAKPDVFMQKIQSYTSINYGFTFLTTNPNPSQVTCGNSSSQCPLWDGSAIYIASGGMSGSKVVTSSTDIHSINNSPGLVGISEVCRLARQGPAGPRRCKISLGGWSDWARLGTPSTAQQVANLIGKMVLYSFADGIDLDFEHLTEFSWIDADKDEFSAFAALIVAIRQQFNAITPSVWSSTAQARYTDIQTEYNAMPDWQKNESPWYPTNMKYMQELQSNGPPYFEITYTTRFNAFVNASNPFNYLAPNSPIPPPFPTRGEGSKIWSTVHNAVDTVNIMAYDAGSPSGALIFDFTKILINFATFGPVPKLSLNMGFEPGDQNAGGVWEGMDVDMATTKYIKDNGYGGVMIWAINPSDTLPNSVHWCPLVAQGAYQAINPSWPFGKAPTYSKCDPSTGWLPANSETNKPNSP
jgi:hypothetical protein